MSGASCPDARRRPDLRTFFASGSDIRHAEFVGRGMRRSNAGIARAKRVTTGPLPRVPVAAMRRAQTLESRMPLMFASAFLGLIAIQAWLAMG